MTPHASHLCERFAAAVAYPRDNLAALLEGCRSAAREFPESVNAPLERFHEAVARCSPDRLQELYVEAFDLDPACALEMGWHLYGERRERGELLARLRNDLRSAGIAESTDLPDHLTHVLLLMSRLPAERSTALAALVAPALDRVLTALRDRHTPYADLVDAIRGLVTVGAAQAAVRG